MMCTRVSVIAVLCAAATTVDAFPQPMSPKYDWTVPFKTGQCTGCPANGVVLPWCVKLNAANLECHYGQEVSPLPRCLSVDPKQIDGQIPSNKISGPIPGNQITGVLGASVRMNAEGLLCEEGQEPVQVPCLELSVENFPNGELPANVVVPADASVEVASLVCTAGDALPDCVSVNPNQIDSPIPASQLGPGYLASDIQCPANSTSSTPLPSCWSIQNRTLSNVTIDSGSTVNGNVGSNTCASIKSNCVKPATFTCTPKGENCTLVCPSGTSFLSGLCPLFIGSLCQVKEYAGVPPNSSFCFFSDVNSEIDATSCNSTSLFPGVAQSVYCW